MALVNHAKREINAKIVICGPTAAGKATLLKAIYSKLPVESRGQLRSMSLQQDRMLFFDFTHPAGSSSDKYSLRLHVYTLTGLISQENAWKMVLKGTDGVVFVADSAPLQKGANRHAFQLMQLALQANGKQLSDLPAVAVFSKQELADKVPVDTLFSELLFPTLPAFPVDSISGSSVLDPLCELLKRILGDLEGLGLDLQPEVKSLCRLVPDRLDKIPPAIVTEPAAPIKPLCDELQIVDADLMSITIDGLPELTAEGELTIGIKASCSGKTARATLCISMKNGR